MGVSDIRVGSSAGVSSEFLLARNPSVGTREVFFEASPGTMFLNFFANGSSWFELDNVCVRRVLPLEEI